MKRNAPTAGTAAAGVDGQDGAIAAKLIICTAKSNAGKVQQRQRASTHDAWLARHVQVAPAPNVSLLPSGPLHDGVALRASSQQRAKPRGRTAQLKARAHRQALNSARSSSVAPSSSQPSRLTGNRRAMRLSDDVQNFAYSAAHAPVKPALLDRALVLCQHGIDRYHLSMSRTLQDSGMLKD